VILAKNKKFWLNKTIFSGEFIQKLLKIFQDIKIKEDNDFQKYSNSSFDLQLQQTGTQFDAFKFIITFFLTVALRSKDRLILADYLVLIKQALNANIGLCLWLVETFSNQHFIKEFFIDCPVHDLSRFVQGMLKTAMERVYSFEKEGIAQYLACY
jgi:hypothetical protein